MTYHKVGKSTGQAFSIGKETKKKKSSDENSTETAK